MKNSLEIRNLEMSFRLGFLSKKVQILNNINLSVPEGSIYGFLGVNGSGKSTTLKIVNGILIPTSGSVNILGHNLVDHKFKEKIGYMPEHPFFYDHFSAVELLLVFSGIFNIPRKKALSKIEELIFKVGLEGKENIALRKYSKGMLQRIGIAQALINDPDLIFLDEPMSGLDPVGRRDVRELIIDISKQGKTVLFSSHIIHDVEMICSHVAFIDKGRTLKEGKINELLDNSFHETEIIFKLTGIPDSLKHAKKRGDRNFILCKNLQEKNQCINSIQENGGEIISMSKTKLDLEELFFEAKESQV